MLHRFSGCKSLLVIKLEESVEELERILGKQVLILCGREFGPRLARMSSDECLRNS